MMVVDVVSVPASSRSMIVQKKFSSAEKQVFIPLKQLFSDLTPLLGKCSLNVPCCACGSERVG